MLEIAIAVRNCSKTETNISMNFSRISQMSEKDIRIKGSFRTIEAAMSVVRTMSNTIPFEHLILFQVESYHNIKLKDDAAASLGINHVTYKIAAHYVEVHDKQMAAGMGIDPSDWQSERVKEKWQEIYKLRELELLKWADIDLNAITL
jgi:hypothetical protein